MMNHKHPEKHHRRSVRLKEYDYTDPGAYFVTICTHNRKPLFGQVVDGEMVMNEFGKIVWACWQEIPHHFPHAELDAFVVMPNHLHGIIVIVGATHASPLRGQVSSPPKNTPPRGPASGSLGAIVGSFKSAATRGINALRHTPGARLWQRNYYEHIIRTDRVLNTIRRYIIENPLRWHLDRYNPNRIGDDPLARTLYHLLQEDARTYSRSSPLSENAALCSNKRNRTNHPEDQR